MESAKNPFEESSPNTPSLPKKSPNPKLVEEAAKLKQKEEELNEREAVLDNRAHILMDRENIREKNAPNWPRCKPILYHDIDQEIRSDELKSLVHFGYKGWLIGEYALIYNIVALLVVVIQDASSTNVGSFVLSIIFLIIGTPISFLIYRALYRAGRKVRPGLFVGYFILLLIEMISYLLFALGWSGSGAGGFVLMVDMFEGKYVVAAIFLIVGCANWVLLTVYSIIIFIRTRIQYKNAGGWKGAKSNFKEAAVTTAKENPELAAKGLQWGVEQARENPELVAQGVKAVV